MYLRNSLAHSPKPSLQECVAGLLAIVEVLRAYGDEATAAQIALTLEDTREVAWLHSGANMQLQLAEEEFAVAMLEGGLEEFTSVMGQRVHEMWQTSPAPALPMELCGGRKPGRSLCGRLRNGGKGKGDGKKPELRKWKEYNEWKGWTSLDTVEDARCGLNHKSDVPLDAAHVQKVIQGITDDPNFLVSFLSYNTPLLLYLSLYSLSLSILSLSLFFLSPYSLSLSVLSLSLFSLSLYSLSLSLSILSLYIVSHRTLYGSHGDDLLRPRR